jgi:hypothetical protein
VLGLLLAIAAPSPNAPEGFFFEIGAGVEGCGGDGCIAVDEASVPIDLAGGYALRPWAGVGVRAMATLFGDVNLDMGSAEVFLWPLAGSDAPLQLYVAAGPAIASGWTRLGSSAEGAKRSWFGFAISTRIGIRFPSSWGGWSIFAQRVLAFGRSECDPGSGDYFYDEECTDSRDVPPQFWILGVAVTIFP